MRTAIVSFVTVCALSTSVANSARAQDSALAAIFAPGVISTSNVYRGTFDADGRTFYYFKKVGPDTSEDYRIYRSRLVGGAWSSPERVSFGGDFSDLYPAISPNGRRMVFTSYRPAPGDTSKKRNAHLWYVDRTGDGWSAPVFMRDATTLGWYHSQPIFRNDGSVYFNRTTPDWSRVEHVVSAWDGTKYGMAAVYDPVTRWKSWRRDLYVWEGAPHPSNAFIVMTVSRVDSVSRRRSLPDLWVSFDRDGSWTEPQPLGAGVNTDQAENFAFFSADGRDLYFVRQFGAIYRVSVDAATRGLRR